MEPLDQYRNIIVDLLKELAVRRYSHGDIKNQAVIDRQGDHYLVMSQGWDKLERIHGTLLHIDIIDGKLWINRDGTEDGIANRLVEQGVPKNKIVLAFHSPEIRKHTDFAVA